MTTASIKVNPNLRGHPLLSCLPAAKYCYGNASGDVDVKEIVCVIETMSEIKFLGEGKKTHFETKLERTRRYTNSSMQYALVLVDISEPDLRVLSMLNESCMSAHFTLLLFWSWEEVAQTLLTLTNNSAPKERYNTAGETGASGAFVNAFSILPGITTTDLVRLVNERPTTVDDLLGVTAEDLAQLPGFGDKKSELFLAVLNCDLRATLTSTSALPLIPLESDDVEDHPTAPVVTKSVADALQKVRDEEEID
jgi:hypothetical protein